MCSKRSPPNGRYSWLPQETGRFPLAKRVGTAVGATHQRAYYDPEGAFEFGLARLLDGVEAFLRQTQPRRVPDQPASSSSSRS